MTGRVLTSLRVRLASAVVFSGLLLGPPVASAHLVTRPGWLSHTRVTEYFPVPEAWFVGARVAAPGIAGRHRVDWLYSAQGVSMEGDGVGLDGNRYHIDAIGSSGWVNAKGRSTRPGPRGWSGGRPFWRAGGYWRSSSGAPTFPLEIGGWFAGAGRSYRAIRDVSFAQGASRPLSYYACVAVDPKLIALGSKVYVPAYRDLTRSRGWFTAADTGGAIIGRHLDVYRPAPATRGDGGRFFADERVYVVPPGR